MTTLPVHKYDVRMVEPDTHLGGSSPGAGLGNGSSAHSPGISSPLSDGDGEGCGWFACSGQVAGPPDYTPLHGFGYGVSCGAFHGPTVVASLPLYVIS